jgi:hypothetical protein
MRNTLKQSSCHGKNRFYDHTKGIEDRLHSRLGGPIEVAMLRLSQLATSILFVAVALSLSAASAGAFSQQSLGVGQDGTGFAVAVRRNCSDKMVLQYSSAFDRAPAR